MDASKAVQALTDGDWHALALALADRSMVIVVPEKDARMTIVTVGRVGVRVVDWPGEPQPKIDVHVHGDVEDAAACFERTIDGAQEGRGQAIAAGLGAGTMYIDGVLTPAPEGAMDPFGAMLAQLKGALERSGAYVMVPNDARDLDGTI